MENVKTAILIIELMRRVRFVDLILATVGNLLNLMVPAQHAKSTHTQILLVKLAPKTLAQTNAKFCQLLASAQTAPTTNTLLLLT